MRRPIHLSILLIVACGGPLDRVDGQLVITLAGVPQQVDAIDVQVRAGGRTFDATFAPTTRIERFTAVPTGPGEVDVTLRAGDTTIDRRTKIPIDIEPEVTFELPLAFDGGPQITIEAPRVHRVYESRSIPVDILDRSFADDLTLTLAANGRPIDLMPRTATGWLVDVDPFVATDILPVDLELVAEACFGDGRCSTTSHVVRVHREVWTQNLPAVSAVAPLVDTATVVAADDSGRLTILDAQTGAIQHTEDLAAPLLVGLARVASSVFVVDGERVVRAVDLATRTRSSWEVALGDVRPSALVSDGARVYAGANRDLVAIDPNTGASSVLHTAPEALRARPHVDAAGFVVVDVLGEVRSLDPRGVVVASWTLGESVRAGPLRVDETIWVGTLGGRLHAIGASPPIALEEPIVHPLLALGDVVVAAAGASVVFATGDGVERVRVPAPITAAPVAYDGGVLVGLRNGLVVAVRADGITRVLSRLADAALGLAIAPDGDVLAVGSDKKISRLRAEEGFLP